MYLPDAFSITDPEEITAVMDRAPLACLVTHGPQGLFATHLPLLHDRERGVLAGHLARPNPHCTSAGDGEALIVFQGPSAYISPNGYASKAIDGKVVPTWNYEAVHVYGVLTWVQDADWMRSLIRALTDRFEAGQPHPWSVDDAPEDFMRMLGRGIVGVELKITRVEAKRKLSQNKGEADRRGVIANLEAGGAPGDLAVAALMRTLT
jgi:transcriptional regulator